MSLGTVELSAEARQLAAQMVRILREEYKDGLRDRRNVDRLLGLWSLEVEKLPAAEARRLLGAIRPLSKGYAGMAAGERQHTLVEVGQALGRLAGEAPRGQTEGVEGPKAGVAKRKLGDKVDFLTGIGPPMAKRLVKLGIDYVEDLLTHYPRRWEDRTQLRPIFQARDGVVETVEGKVGTPVTKTPRPGMRIVQASLTDSTGTLQLVWFNQPYIAKQLIPGQKLTATGKVEKRFHETQINTPEIETGNVRINSGRIVPIYPSTGTIQQKWWRKTMWEVVPTYARLLPELLPAEVVARRGFVRRAEAVTEYHWPTSYDARERARLRLAYEELFLLQLDVGLQRQERERDPRQTFYPRGDIADFEKLLPFEPTGAQRRTMGEIAEDLKRDTPMNRLLQGDVGSGKTAVAAYAAWVAVQNGYQAAIMAPTEILADQHYRKLVELMGPAGIQVGRLSGSMKKKEKQSVCEALREHTLDVVVGTHALIQESVDFARLGMVVVDEQHKFGVMQRTVLKQKGLNPDLLVMTATPIPRTLALTLYGDLEVSRLDELPPGRQPILSESVPFSERRRVYDEIRAQIRAGRQAYIICPLVEESENLQATSAVEEAAVVQREVFPEFSVGLLHGRMKAAEKEAVMERFRVGEHQILISTTVIEVGVDVPNSTFMLVQDANRFGLAQLHQLRGRVGRGQHASRCVFMGDASSEEGQRRLRAIARLADGFDVAEEDLQIRGPGDFYGFRQSGFPELKVADLLRDQELLELVRNDVRALLAGDPELKGHPDLRDSMTKRRVDSAELIH